jgi:hypothetical protein
MPSGDTRLEYLPFEKLTVPRPVDRIRHVCSACAGRRVLDLGAYDETEVKRKQVGAWRWLHREIAAVASDVLGVDSSTELQAAGSVTTDAGTEIRFGRVEDLGSVVAAFRPEIIVAGELIEHTPDTLGWLAALAAHAPGVRLVVTTPNATSILNLALAFARRENCHPDHLQIYSFKTLTTLANRFGLDDFTIVPYYYDSQLLQGRAPRMVRPLVLATDRTVLRAIQWLFPLTSFGLILDGRFPAVDSVPDPLRAPRL